MFVCVCVHEHSFHISPPTHTRVHTYTHTHNTQLDKYRVEGMELYSTVLWHMKREADLSYLAQDMVATDRLAPQVWVCVRE